jgi:glutamate synthase (NADPH/NADH) small chain
VTVFEKNSRIGGLLRYGIPDFKMEKSHIDRRVAQMEAEGVVFRTGVLVGALPADSKVTNDAKTPSAPSSCKAEFDAVLLTGGSRAEPRPAGARPRAGWRALRDGVPAAAEQGRGRRQAQGPDRPPASTSS